MNDQTEIVLQSSISREVVVVENGNGLVVSSPSGTNTAISNSQDVVVRVTQEDASVVITSGIILANGPSIEDYTMYTKLTDFVNDSTLYRGEAVPGSLEASPVWRIRKIIISAVDGDIEEKWADGNANFDNVWTDRAVKAYS